MKKLKYNKILFFIFVCICFFLTDNYIVKANSESFYSRTLLGRIADNSWQQAGSVSSTGNSITLSSDALSSYYPYWIGGYGNKSGNFETNKTYFLNFKVNYPSTTQFDFKKAMQYATMEISITNVKVNLCTLESNTNTYSTFTCQFTVSSASSYYEFNVNWYNSNLYQLGFEPIYNYEKATLSIDFVLSSQTDNSGLIVEQNEIIIGQNQQIIDSTNDVNNSVNDVNDTLKDDNIDTSKTTIEDKSADASKSPISSLLTLPLKLLNNIHTGLSGTCSALNLGSLLGTDLVLPCINLEQRLGSYLWGLIDYAFCIFLIYNVGMLAVKIWTDVIMMRDFFSELYKPQGEKGGKDK